MAKYTVVALVIALLGASFANAATMSLNERIAVGKKIDKSVPFVKEKYLPASFVKELEGNFKSAQDKAELKKIQTNWSKYYSKDIGYRVFGTTFEVTYKKVPVVAITVTSLKPYTVKINNGSQMIIRKDRYFADMSEALKDAGYDFSGKKKRSALLDWILPEAYAEVAVAKTVENSIFILGGTTFTQMEDGSLAPAMIVTKAMATTGGLYAGLDEASCAGERLQGTYKAQYGNYSYGQGKTMDVSFIADRARGIYMKAGDHHIVGKSVPSEATEFCQEIAKGTVIDLKQEIQMKGFGRHRSACLYLQKMRPESGLACSENKAEGQPAQEVFVAECAAMKQVGLSSSFKFFACKDANCKDSEMTELPADVQNTRQLVAWQKWGPEAEAAKKAVRDEFAQEIRAGLIKEENGVFSIAANSGSDTMKGSRISKFNALVAKIPAKPTEDKNGPYFDFAFSSKGFVGLMDCCYDAECKAKVYEASGLDLVPAKGAQ